MNKHKADDPDTQNPGNWKRKRKQEIDILPVGRKKATAANVIDKLPDDVLIAILSRTSIKDAVRTSVLSRRWRYLWMFTHGTLEFNDRDITTIGNKSMKMLYFEDVLIRILELHQAPSVDSLLIRFRNRWEESFSSPLTKSVVFAILKDVKRFDLDLSVPGGSRCNYEFPGLVRLLYRFPKDKLLPLLDKFGSYSYSCCLRSLNAFISLRSLRLVNVDIEDEVARYFIDSCPYIEKLCIRGSKATKDLEFVDPLPNLKVLEISECCNIQSLVISVANLVSCTCEGNEIGLPFKKVPNLSELTLGGSLCESFVYEPNKHSSYSSQLVKLVLNLHTASVLREIVPPDLPQLCALERMELSIVSQVGRSLLFLTSLIKASPKLQEFKLKINYLVPCSPYADVLSLIPFPEVTSAEANIFKHKHLKAIEVDGYCGCESEEKFIARMCKIAATSLETVIIDTDCDYYRDHPKYDLYIVMYKPREDGEVPMMKGVKKGKTFHLDPIENGDMNRFDAKRRAERFTSGFRSSRIKFVVR